LWWRSLLAVAEHPRDRRTGWHFLLEVVALLLFLFDLYVQKLYYVDEAFSKRKKYALTARCCSCCAWRGGVTAGLCV
jgi:hypothetical protein